MEKVLYIYGYGSNPYNSSTMKVMKTIVEEIGFELVSIEYDQKFIGNSLTTLEEYINNNNIKYVIGHSLGGFITLCLNSNVKKLVINPCLKPTIELPKLNKSIGKELYPYKILEKWLKSGADTPWVSQSDDVVGLFGDHDELFSYYDEFKKQWPCAYMINSTHRPTVESFTEDIKTKIKEFFS